jgi:hypothetical protein
MIEIQRVDPDEFAWPLLALQARCFERPTLSYSLDRKPIDAYFVCAQRLDETTIEERTSGDRTIE